VDARGGYGNEEILEVHAKHHGSSRVNAGVRENAAPTSKPMSGFVRGHPIEDLAQNPPLQSLETRLRRFHQAKAAGALRQPSIDVVAQTRRSVVAGQSSPIREPSEGGDVLAEPDGDVARRRELGHVPIRPARSHGWLGQKESPEAEDLSPWAEPLLEARIARDRGCQVAKAIARRVRKRRVDPLRRPS
jgi:hypothetical protein